MALFRKKKKEEVDDRTNLEKTFEEKGQALGRKTGTLVQKGVDKLEKVKSKLEDDGKMDKIRDISNKIDDTVDKVVDTVTKKTKEVVSKVKEKKETQKDYYE